MEGKITGVLYAVFRVNEKRIKSLKDVRRFKVHMEREQQTLNADENKKQYNKILIGETDVYKTLKKHIEGCSLRSDSNLAHEIVLTASREYFRNITDTQKEMWVEANLKFIEEKFGDSCIYAMLHMDETTPHLHILISNKTKNRWGQDTINNSVYFGGKSFEGREKLRKWQDDYGEAMSQFNLSRGIRFSKATHVQLRQFYSLVNDNMSMEKLNRVVESNYRYNYIKEEFQCVIDDIEKHRTPLNSEDINILKKEMYKLSNLTTAPDKFYSEEKENIQRDKVNNMLINYNIDIIDNIKGITRNAHKERRETSLEAYTRIVAETRIKRETLELKKIIKSMGEDAELNKKDRLALDRQLTRLKEDKEIYKTVIKTLSEYHHVPQQAIERIIRTAKEKGIEREMK